MKVKIVNKSKNPLPSYATEGSAGMDLYSNLTVSIPAGARRMIPTGIFIEVPPGYEAQVRPKSGRAIKEGLTVLNSPGTIDSDFRGEVLVIIHNTSNMPTVIFSGQKIAQMVVAQYERVEWEQDQELSETERGTGGFGSTGI